jgi:hypothetical protein
VLLAASATDGAMRWLVGMCGGLIIAVIGVTAHAPPLLTGIAVGVFSFAVYLGPLLLRGARQDSRDSD